MFQGTKYFRQIYVFIIENLSHWREKERERERERERIPCYSMLVEYDRTK